ncbi:MAG: peptidoglycan-binding protein [Phormidesmis sp.]
METSTLVPALQLGDRGPDVIALQSLLNDRFAGGSASNAIRPLALDGIYGLKTEAVVKVAQFRYLLFQDGMAGPRTVRSLQDDRALIGALPTLRRGDRGRDVIALQVILSPNSVGFADGVFGPHTELSVQSFQGTSRLPINGVVGSHTWRQLELRAFRLSPRGQTSPRG